MRILLLAALLVSCQGCPKPGPTPVPPGPPAASCAAACAHLDALACPNNGACPGVCAAVDSPTFSACLAAAEDCAAADRCDSR